MNDNAQIRNEQQRDAERRTLSARPGHTSKPPRKPFVAKGHDAILKKVQDLGGEIGIMPMNGDSLIVGKLIARDKYTITVLTKDGREVTFYKHAIESFESVRVQ